MKLILGTKQSMTQVFDETGRVRPATVLAVSPLTVTAARGGKRIQVGYGERKLSRLAKPQRGALSREGYSFATLKEFVADDEYQVGDKIDSSIFSPGDKVKVSAISKGKGFQGVVKRHGFHGGPRTHGQKHSEREPGSIGATGPQRVFKGTRMAGRMGADRVTVSNLEILAVDQAAGVVVVSGAIPGRRGTLVEIKK
ncbi:MAG: 50S ribosomal protein L3 [Candidatus Vogelbacteria bacterium GWA1_51_14]|uniref:50S ribosomal protein L3 n=1 Tax=Candidatus Vogelbacteria bacterium GWA1_51_14 TaxID=1802435 RepID=A0A1G2Q831_9BACT|nr:MAG: 50S ribosomal protein L3 [Candidatus Vogelbacteria bacterium GWA1_51_14]